MAYIGAYVGVFLQAGDFYFYALDNISVVEDEDTLPFQYLQNLELKVPDKGEE